MKGFERRRSRSRTQASVKKAVLRIRRMYDEMDRLRELDALQRLLQHYRDLGRLDRTIWQDRVLTMDGLETRELVKLHGELLAYGWVEMNTGDTPNVRGSAAPASYRVTTAGIRALKQLREESELVG